MLNAPHRKNGFLSAPLRHKSEELEGVGEKKFINHIFLMSQKKNQSVGVEADEEERLVMQLHLPGNVYNAETSPKGTAQ